MAVLMEERRDFPFGNLTPGYGSFAVGYLKPDGTWNGWQTCREVMQKQFTLDQSGLWFSYEPIELKGIIEFMTWIERTVRIQDRTRFYQTEPVRYFSWVEPSRFWMQDEMRKNIFTMFLRNARFYAQQPEGDRNVRKALLDYVYSKETMPALERFFMGFTKYVGPPLVPHYEGSTYIKMGWYSQFCNQKPDHIRRFLKSPDWTPPVQVVEVEPTIILH